MLVLVPEAPVCGEASCLDFARSAGEREGFPRKFLFPENGFRGHDRVARLFRQPIGPCHPPGNPGQGAGLGFHPAHVADHAGIRQVLARLRHLPRTAQRSLPEKNSAACLTCSQRRNARTAPETRAMVPSGGSLFRSPATRTRLPGITALIHCLRPRISVWPQTNTAALIVSSKSIQPKRSVPPTSHQRIGTSKM